MALTSSSRAQASDLHARRRATASGGGRDVRLSSVQKHRDESPTGDGGRDLTRAIGETTVLTVASAGWVVGIGLGVVVIAVAAVIVITIVMLAQRISVQADTADRGVGVVRKQTSELSGIERINDSGVRILHSARALRKAIVGK
jgi:hypothetical protein